MTCLTPSKTGLIHTPEDALDLVKQSLSPNTRRAYYGWLRSFETFCDGNEPHTHGEADRVMASWIAGLHGRGLTPSSISQAVSALRYFARVWGLLGPSPITASTLSGIRRTGANRGPGPVAGMGWSAAHVVCTVTSRSRPVRAGLRDAALISVMSDALLRVSEVVVLTMDGANTVRLWLADACETHV